MVNPASTGQPTLEQLGGWPSILGRLACAGDLSAEEAGAALDEVLAGEASPAQVAAFVFGLRCKGETVTEMTGLVRAMVRAAVPLPVDPELRARLVDTCGTGGDRSGTINVSTVAALVIAGAGVPVCKHGGRAASSLAASADVLEALGVAIELGPAGVARCIEEAGIGFCFAPRYHPAMRHAAPVRRELGVPTVFNFLGPLTNPAGVRRQVVGVSDPAMAATMAGVLAANGATHVAVVYGADGLDELSTTGPSTIVTTHARGSTGGVEVPDVEVQTEIVDPADLGLAPANLEDLRGGDAVANAGYTRQVLAGEPGAHRDIVVLNAAAGLVVAGVAEDLADGVVAAADAIDSGGAAAALERLVRVSQTLA